MTGLMDLLNGVVRRGNAAAKQNAEQLAETVSSTIRFGGDLRRFLEAQAEAWGGISTQAVITTILTGVMNDTLSPTPADRIDVIPARIVRLFELHGIDLPIAADILGVPFSDMKPERLLSHVNNALIDRLTEDFAIEKRWLLGDTDSPGRKIIDWYKSPGCGARRILKLTELGLKPKVYFLKSNSWDLNKSKEEDKTTQSNNFLIVVELTRKVNPNNSNSIEYNTYEMWQDAPWDYQKSRLDILTLVMFCQKMNGSKPWHVARDLGLDPEYFVSCGKEFTWSDQQIDKQAFDDLRHFRILPSQLLQSFHIVRQKSGVKGISIGPWAYLDDYLDSPKESCVSKRDDKEYGYVVEQYNEVMRWIKDDIHWKRKEKANTQKHEEEAKDYEPEQVFDQTHEEQQ